MTRECHVRFWESAGVRFPCATHSPLYRQSEIYAREGVDLDRSTLAGWVGPATGLIAPLIDQIRKHVMAGSKIHADDTPVPVLAPGNGKTSTGRLWTYVRDDRPAGYTITQNRLFTSRLTTLDKCPLKLSGHFEPRDSISVKRGTSHAYLERRVCAGEIATGRVSTFRNLAIRGLSSAARRMHAR